MKILPPGVSCAKEIIDGTQIYNFRHHKLGSLGRIVIQSLPGRNSNISYEVSGDSSDPMSAERLEILKPIHEKIMLEMRKQLPPGDPSLAQHAPPTPSSGEFVKSQGNPCDICGEFTSILIFANNGFRQSDVEDYARKMYPVYSQHDTPTWIIADPDEGNNDQNSSILAMQVRPERKPIILTTPKELNVILEKLDKAHCKK